MPVGAYAVDGDSGGALDASLPSINAVSTSQLTPGMALNSYLLHAQDQLANLGSYSDLTTIEAQIPSTSQRGRYRLRRVFSRPKTLTFTGLEFAGDAFVKNNVITRLLQSEADHVQKEDGASVAISAANYKFSYRGTTEMNGRTAYDYQVKPRSKRVGLFKGHMFLASSDASLLRAEGTMVKSPSLFIRKVRFSQDYAQVNGFNLAVHIHSEADTRLIGRAIVDISHEYEQALSTTPARPAAGSDVASSISSPGGN